MSWDFVKDPSTGHEYVNNILIADALKEIPINSSLIITNDFRYPADNYIRDLRQLQLPAIYGHQLYASNWIYSGNRHVTDAYQRLSEQRLIRATDWNPIIYTLAKEHGWTHLLLDKSVGTLAAESFWKKDIISLRDSSRIFFRLKKSGIINQGNVLNEEDDIGDIVLDNIIGIEYSKNLEHIIQVLKQSRMKFPRNIPLPLIYENSRYRIYTLRKTK
jgi:hypothetical protein